MRAARLLVVAFLLAQLLDCLTTVVAIADFGAHEGNALVGVGRGIPLLVMKCIAMVLIPYIALRLLSGWRQVAGLGAVVVAASWAPLHNVAVMAGWS